MASSRLYSHQSPALVGTRRACRAGELRVICACIREICFFRFSMGPKHHENCKKVEVQYGFYACALGVSTDSVFPSSVAHLGAVVKCRLRRSVILATIYCPNGNRNFRLFETINNLSDNVMFVGDFNSKLEAFGCAKKNSSGPMLKNIQSHLNLTYLNNDEHTHLDRAKGSTDILDMAFISPNLTKHDIQFLIGDDLGSDHLPIEISIDAQPHRNTHTNPIR